MPLLQSSQLLFQFLLSSHDLHSSLNLRQLLNPHRALARLPPSQALGAVMAARSISLCEEEDHKAPY